MFLSILMLKFAFKSKNHSPKKECSSLQLYLRINEQKKDQQKKENFNKMLSRAKN